MIKICIKEFIIEEIHTEPGFNKNDDVMITMRRCLEKGLCFRTHTTDILKINIEICIMLSITGPASWPESVRGLAEILS